MFLTIKLGTHARLNFFKTELIICIQVDLVLYNLQMLIFHKTQTTDQLFCYIEDILLIYPRNKDQKKSYID